MKRFGPVLVFVAVVLVALASALLSAHLNLKVK